MTLLTSLQPHLAARCATWVSPCTSQGADEISLLNTTSFCSSPVAEQPRGGARARTAGSGRDVPRSTLLKVAGGVLSRRRTGADQVSIGSKAVYAIKCSLRMEWGEADKANGKGTAMETISKAYRIVSNSAPGRLGQ